MDRKYCKSQQRLIDEYLLPLMDHIKMSDRDRLIVKGSVHGKTFAELGKEHGLSRERVRAIIAQYFCHCKWFIAKLPGNFKKGQILDINTSILNNGNIIICDCDYLGVSIDKVHKKILQIKALGNIIYEDWTKKCEPTEKDLNFDNPEDRIGLIFFKILHNKASEHEVDFLIENGFNIWVY